MPQMSPMWWFSLMILFIITFFIAISYTYFNINYSIKFYKTFKINNLNWSW